MKVKVNHAEDQPRSVGIFPPSCCRPAAEFIRSAIRLLSDRDRDAAELPSDGSKMDGEGALSKRRHSRPLELDSEGEENDTSGKEEEPLTDREEEPEETEAPDRLLSRKVRGAIIFHLLLPFSSWIIYTFHHVFRKVEKRRVMMKKRQTRPVRAAQIHLMMVRPAATAGCVSVVFPALPCFFTLFLPQKRKVHPTPRQAQTPHQQARTPRSMR